jgi:serine/threonine protein kinase
MGFRQKRKVLLTIFKQIVEGIEYVHSAGIIHSDIKAANFMVHEKPNQEFVAYVIDLGSGI